MTPPEDRDARAKPRRMIGMRDWSDTALLPPGDAIEIIDRDDLLEALDELDQPVPPRHEGRTTSQRERFVMLRYLRVLAGMGELQLPIKIQKHPEGVGRPPDFLLSWPETQRTETFELTDGSTREYQERLSATSTDREVLVLPVGINTPEREAVQLWAEIIFTAFRRKAEALVAGRYSLDHLLIYDLTGLGLLLPLERGKSILGELVRRWYSQLSPQYRFARISVVRDLALLLDVAGAARVLPLRESPYFQLPVLRARDEPTLQENLRKLDRFCRTNSIRHLKMFGSILGDMIKDFGETSDLDLLVEFDSGARVTLLDMARMERELSELTGFKVDLRTAEDLSRYFRDEVLQEAVEIDAAPK
jgi:predicted nucleotidyltransferase